MEEEEQRTGEEEDKEDTDRKTKNKPLKTIPTTIQTKTIYTREKLQQTF